MLFWGWARLCWLSCGFSPFYSLWPCPAEPTRFSDSPAGHLWDQHLCVEVRIPPWIVNDGDWSSALKQYSRSLLARLRTPKELSVFHSAQGCTCWGTTMGEIFTAPYLFLKPISLLSLPPLSTSSPTGHRSAQINFFPVASLLPRDQLTSQVNLVLLFPELTRLPGS